MISKEEKGGVFLKSIRLLDCTLRDGGYINDWNFGFQQIKQIIESLIKSNVDIIECGYLDTSKESNKESTRFNNVKDLDRFKKPNSLSIFSGK